MAIRTVVTAGYGNGTFNGTIADVVTRGYTIGAQAAVAAVEDDTGGPVERTDWQGIHAAREEARLQHMRRDEREVIEIVTILMQSGVL